VRHKLVSSEFKAAIWAAWFSVQRLAADPTDANEAELVAARFNYALDSVFD